MMQLQGTAVAPWHNGEPLMVPRAKLPSGEGPLNVKVSWQVAVHMMRV